ncbi:MAG: hypothetical protein PVJ08_03880 [Dehalococcoidia bacterium]|jgi:hypothetical protein
MAGDERIKEIFKKTPDDLHAEVSVALEKIKAGANPDDYPIISMLFGKNTLFVKQIVDLELDYFTHPFMHQIERGVLSGKIKAMLMLTSYLNREPKDKHGIKMWSAYARKCGATDQEILECAACANIAGAKVQLVSTDEVMTEVFDSPEFKAAKPE